MPPRTRLHLPAALLRATVLAAGIAAGATFLGADAPVAVCGSAFAVLALVHGRLHREVALRRQVMDAAPYRTLIFDADQRLIWHNGREGQPWHDALASLPPRPRLEQLLKAGLWHLSTAEREAEICRRLREHERADGRPTEILNANGSWERVRRVRLPHGEVVTYAVDISSVKQAEIALAGSEARLRSVLDTTPVGIWQLDEDGRTVFANRHLLRLFGGKAPTDMQASRVALAGPADATGPFGFTPDGESEAALELPGGGQLRLLVAASPWISGADGKRGCVLSLLDVTPFRAAQQRIEHLAEHDPLTGLCNRATFHAALEAMAADPKGGLLLLIDLDHFKSANDRYGHGVGDALLVEAARRLRDAVRPADVVSRLGGDEFAVLAFGATEDSALLVANRVREGLRGNLRIQGAEISVSASIGIATAPLHGEDAAAVMRAADLALYEAKGLGRDSVSLFQPELREKSEKRAEMREAFAEALESEELELHLQPQQDMERQVMVGAEALIRWNSKRLGRWVSPAEMLPAAGEAGLLHRLDRFVLRRAVDIIASWGDRADAPLHLGINISIATLHDVGFAKEVADILSSRGVAPERLEIEIPEDLAIRDLASVARTLSALREVGVPLSLDDFGGGHSGLPHVVRLPVQRLKLDRSIVAGLPDDPKSYAVLRATMALARGMGIEVIGEGVETQAQAFALRRAGCHIIQGWLIAKPMPAGLLLPPLHEARKPDGKPLPLRARA